MNILGVELEFDFFDADNIDLYEKENIKVSDRIKEPTQYEGKTTGEQLKIQCGIVKDFFNNVFGPGTSDRIFGARNNIKECMEAFAAVSEAAMSTKGELQRLTNKYQSNRAERRNAQFDKNKNRNNAAHKGNH